MTRTKLIITICYIVTFAAGTTMGLVASLPDASPAGPRDSMFSDELNLTDEQRQKMQEIWSEAARESMRDADRNRWQLISEKNEAVRNLLTDEQKQQIDQIESDFQQKMEDLHRQQRQIFERANEQTRAILNDQQRAVFDQMLERGRGWFRGHYGPGGPRRPGGPGGPGRGFDRNGPGGPGGPGPKGRGGPDRPFRPPLMQPKSAPQPDEKTDQPNPSSLTPQRKTGVSRPQYT